MSRRDILKPRGGSATKKRPPSRTSLMCDRDLAEELRDAQAYLRRKSLVGLTEEILREGLEKRRIKKLGEGVPWPAREQ